MTAPAQHGGNTEQGVECPVCGARGEPFPCKHHVNYARALLARAVEAERERDQERQLRKQNEETHVGWVRAGSAEERRAAEAERHYAEDIDEAEEREGRLQKQLAELREAVKRVQDEIDPDLHPAIRNLYVLAGCDWDFDRLARTATDPEEGKDG